MGVDAVEPILGVVLGVRKQRPGGEPASADDAGVVRGRRDLRLADDAAVGVEHREATAAERGRHDARTGSLDVVRADRHARAAPQRRVGERVDGDRPGVAAGDVGDLAAEGDVLWRGVACRMRTRPAAP